MSGFSLFQCYAQGDGDIDADDGSGRSRDDKPRVRHNAQNGETDKNDDGTDEKEVAHTVVSPCFGMKLQAEEGYLADEQVATEQRQHEQYGGAGGVDVDFAELACRHHTCPEECVWRSGEADKVGGLTLIEVELGKAQCGEGSHE